MAADSVEAAVRMVASGFRNPGRPLVPFAAAAAAALVACAPERAAETPLARDRPRHVFLFVGDGMGLAQVEAARVLRTLEHDRTLANGVLPLSFTELPTAGVLSTQAANLLVTDSAAAATALASGEKTDYGMIGVLPDGQTALRSVAELARDRGMKVGIVTSVSLDHATPAAFYAHQSSRASFHAIARELAASSFDFFGGGGFLEPVAAEGTPLPAGEPADIYELLPERGYRVERVHWTDAGLVTETGTLAVAPDDEGRDHLVLIDEHLDGQQAMRFAIDRPPEWANLSDYTRAAIAHLSGPTGFFLMVEAGRIDWACHAHDVAAAIGDVLELSDAVDAALAFQREHPDDTLVVVTADHETGGLALGKGMGDGAGFQSALSGQRASADHYGRGLRARLAATPGLSLLDLAPELEATFRVALTLEGAAPPEPAEAEDLTVFSAAETTALAEALEVTRGAVAAGTGRADRDPFAEAVASTVGTHAGVGWGSADHTGAPVGVFASGVGQERFEGVLHSTDVGTSLKRLLPEPAPSR